MRAIWRRMVDASRQEALQAADHYNQPSDRRSLEGFFVHMHMAWLYLLHSRFRRDGIDYRYRLSNGRFERIDGEPKTWDLKRCTQERWTNNHPVRKNLELTIALRNKVEHRYQEAITLASSGYAQALLLNYEEEITSTFGQEYSLSNELRFPVFVGTFTREGIARMAQAQQKLPSKVKKFLTDFEANLDPSIAADPRYEFRIHLVPKTGPKTEADMSITFVREDQLTDEERKTLANLGRTGTVVVRERIRLVVHADKMKPSEAARAVQERLPFKFNQSYFTQAWKKLAVRPERGAEHPERTDDRYCLYDAAHKDYVYTSAFVEKVVREVDTPDKFTSFFGKPPEAKLA